MEQKALWNTLASPVTCILSMKAMSGKHWVLHYDWCSELLLLSVSEKPVGSSHLLGEQCSPVAKMFIYNVCDTVIVSMWNQDRKVTLQQNMCD